MFMPPGSSTIAPEVDSLFYFITVASVAIFAIVTALTVLFIILYRRRGEPGLTSGKDHSLGLELVWTIIPTILILVVFAWGFKGYMKMSVVPQGATEIKVTGQKWFWSFDYPEGMSTVNELVVPVGKPIKLLMSSKDVIHSFFVPSFRMKMDVVPNRYTITWFEATKTGNYQLFCTEYCGTKHSSMIGLVKVVTEEEYAKWLDASSGPGEGVTPAEWGAQLFKSRACITCHSTDGTKIVGPSLKDRYGATSFFTDGTSATVDENYVRESILLPRAKVVAGYDPVMPTFQGILKERDVDALIAYIKSLSKQE